MKLTKHNEYNVQLMSECFIGWSDTDANQTYGMNMWHFFKGSGRSGEYKGPSGGIEPLFDACKIKKKLSDPAVIQRLKISQKEVDSLLIEIEKLK